MFVEEASSLSDAVTSIVRRCDVIAELRLCDDRADILPDECDIVAVILTIIRNAADCCCGLIVCEFVSVFVVQLDFRRLCARIYIAAGDQANVSAKAPCRLHCRSKCCLQLSF